MLLDALRRLFASGPPDGASGRADRALQPAPPDAFAAALARGNAQLAGGDGESAAATFGEALAIASDDLARAVAHNKRGVAAIAAGRRDDALADFLEALRLHATHAPALVNVGNMLLEERALEDAIDYYEAAIRADEAYAPAYRHLGIACKRAGRYAEGVRNLRLASKLEAKSAAVPNRPRGFGRA